MTLKEMYFNRGVIDWCEIHLYKVSYRMGSRQRSIKHLMSNVGLARTTTYFKLSYDVVLREFRPRAEISGRIDAEGIR